MPDRRHAPISILFLLLQSIWCAIEVPCAIAREHKDNPSMAVSIAQLKERVEALWRCEPGFEQTHAQLIEIQDDVHMFRRRVLTSPKRVRRQCEPLLNTIEYDARELDKLLSHVEIEKMCAAHANYEAHLLPIGQRVDISPFTSGERSTLKGFDSNSTVNH
jgi:hypothetical protein